MLSSPERAMASHRALLLLKLIAVVAYAGGMIASFLATGIHERKRAVHSVASPALLVTWLLGYLLSLDYQVGLSELWIGGALGLSFVSQLVLVHSVSRDRPTKAHFAGVFVPFVGVLFLMVFRPTWQTLRP